MTKHTITVAVAVLGSGAGPADAACVYRLGEKTHTRIVELGTHTANRAVTLAIADALTKQWLSRPTEIEVRTNNNTALAWIRDRDERAAEATEATDRRNAEGIRVAFRKVTNGDLDLEAARDVLRVCAPIDSGIAR